MITKLSRWAQQTLKKKKYKFVHTSFVTRDGGPANGTIWFNKAEPTKPPRTVDCTVKAVKRVSGAYVWYERFPGSDPTDEQDRDTLEHFLDMCDIGAYILIGVTPEVIAHTEI